MAERPSDSQEAQSQRDPQTGQMARKPQGGGVARSSRDPSTMSPLDFFRASPFALMRRMTEDFDRMWNTLGFGSGQGESGMWSPAIEVAERDGKFMVHAELPGIKPEDVQVELNENDLVIKGERKYEHKDESGSVRRTERSYGSFYRSIPIPEGINPDQIDAKFDNGVLQITAPMPARQSNTRSIPVQAGQQSSTQNQPDQNQQREITH